MKNVYKENGYENRRDYLVAQAEWYGVDMWQVDLLAEMLGSSEDFDGLVTSLQDLKEGF